MSNNDWKYLTLNRDGRVLTVEFDSGSKVNSLNNALMRELTALAVDLQEDSALSAIILSGRSDTFTGGMDLKDPEAAAARDATVAQKRIPLKVGPGMCAVGVNQSCGTDNLVDDLAGLVVFVRPRCSRDKNCLRCQALPLIKTERPVIQR